MGNDKISFIIELHAAVGDIDTAFAFSAFAFLTQACCVLDVGAGFRVQSRS
jgi:hypothetical protein